MLVGQMTLVSRILGLVRDSVIAAVFGASHETDAFFVAFRIPNLFRRLFAEGAFSQAFVPVLGAYKAQKTSEETRALTNAVTGVLAVILLLVTVAGVLAAPVVVAAAAPGFLKDPDRFRLSVTLLRLTFPYLLFIALTALLAGILNTYRHFAIPAFTPTLLNVAIIGCAVWLAPHLAQPIMALAVGVLVGGILQLSLQIVAAHRAGILPRPRWNPAHPGVQRILRLMLPAVFGVSVAQLNFLVDTLIASFLREGSISWLYFSDRLMEFPLGIFGVALGTVILPSLSEHHAVGDDVLFSDTLDWSLRLVLLITIPSAVGLAVMAGPILSTLFQYGRMSELDVIMSARSLVTYAFGLSGFILVKVLAPGFFSRQDVRTPVKIGVVALVSNFVLNLALVVPMQHAGLALATSIAAFINAGCLLHILRKRQIYRPRPGWRLFLARLSLAAAGMALLMNRLDYSQSQWTDWHMAARALHLGPLILFGIVAYASLCFIFGLRPQHVAQPGPRL